MKRGGKPEGPIPEGLKGLRRKYKDNGLLVKLEGPSKGSTGIRGNERWQDNVKRRTNEQVSNAEEKR